ncbi:right-handed parallel beta-helix repeat-containing protein [bacterium]|nr:right-handed parallel beta-helix repeat-containing protein [bacterium]
MKCRLIIISILVLCQVGWSTIYRVGEIQQFKSPNEVPWEKLLPGDVVEIYPRLLPYRSKWVMCVQGRKGLPITVRGIPDKDGLLPIIDGRNATTRSALNYWGEERAVIKIGGANQPADTMPSHLVIENLDIRGGRRGNVFTGRTGKSEYLKNGAAIYIEKGRFITLRGCVFHDCGNGLITSSDVENVHIDACHFYGNGNIGSIYEHNAYTSVRGIVFEHCRFGPLLRGARGNNLKDRSAGLVVRYNWIEGGTRMLDLVDADDPRTSGDPRYLETHVYGNVLIKTSVASNNQVIHFGGDSGKKDRYRNGMLYLFNNTVVSKRKDNTTLVRFSSEQQSLYLANNLVYTEESPGTHLALIAGDGAIYGYRNWFKKGWKVNRSPMKAEANLSDTLDGDNPMFSAPAQDDYRLGAGSPCLASGAFLKSALVPEYSVKYQYVPGGKGLSRVRNGQANHGRPDIGAYEAAGE